MSLSIENLSLSLGQDAGAIRLLSEITTKLTRGNLIALIGPSGCGKTTFIKMIAGIVNGHEEGNIVWNGKNLLEKNFSPGEIGYVSQFSVIQDELTVEESVQFTARLRVSEISDRACLDLVDNILIEVALTELRHHRVNTLSGGQKRRLALAIELVSNPPILLCDEVTSGLDPQAEEEIVQLLSRLAHDRGQLVLLVTHSINQLDIFDRILVLYKGRLAFDAHPSYLNHYFKVDDPNLIFNQLVRLDVDEWHQCWRKSSSDYIGRGDWSGREIDASNSSCSEFIDPLSFSTPPSFYSQFVTLLKRRSKIFFRSHPQIMLQMGLILGFPAMVAIFGWNGIPAIQNMGMGSDMSFITHLIEANKFVIQATKIGSLVSGIAMFQVILLSLMGANNSGREIAGERPLLEKEKIAGLNTSSYIASKVVFLGILCLVQSIWMGLFVHFTCIYPGNLGLQLIFLFLVNASLTSVCLAISSFMGSVEQASLVSIYLVGFQLPLSGAVLSLPDWIGVTVRPFIAAYWSWSGVLQSLRETRYYDIVCMVAQTGLNRSNLCIVILLIQIIAGLTIAFFGCRRLQLSAL